MAEAVAEKAGQDRSQLYLYQNLLHILPSPFASVSLIRMSRTVATRSFASHAPYCHSNDTLLFSSSRPFCIFFTVSFHSVSPTCALASSFPFTSLSSPEREREGRDGRRWERRGEVQAYDMSLTASDSTILPRRCRTTRTEREFGVVVVGLIVSTGTIEEC